MAQFDESKHRRDEDGKFTEKEGGGDPGKNRSGFSSRSDAILSGASAAGGTFGAVALRAARPLLHRSGASIVDAVDGAIAGVKSNGKRVRVVGGASGKAPGGLSASRDVVPWTGRSGVEMVTDPPNAFRRAVEGAKAGVKAGRKFDEAVWLGRVTRTASKAQMMAASARRMRVATRAFLPVVGASLAAGAIVGGITGNRLWEAGREPKAQKGADMNMVLVKAADLRKFDESKIKRDEDGKFDDKPGVGDEGGGSKGSPEPKNDKRPSFGRRVLGGIGGMGIGGVVGGVLGTLAPRRLRLAGIVGGGLAGQAVGFGAGMKRTADRESQGKRSFLPTLGGAAVGSALLPGIGLLPGAYLAHRGADNLAARGYGPNAAKKVDEGELRKMAAALSAMDPTERTVTLIKLTQAANAPLDAPVPDGLSKKWVDYARQMMSSKDGNDPIEQAMMGGGAAPTHMAAPGEPGAMLPRMKAKQLCSDVAQRAAQAVGTEGEAYRSGYVAGQKRAQRWGAPATGAPPEEDEEEKTEAPEGEEPEEEEAEAGSEAKEQDEPEEGDGEQKRGRG